MDSWVKLNQAQDISGLAGHQLHQWLVKNCTNFTYWFAVPSCDQAWQCLAICYGYGKFYNNGKLIYDWLVVSTPLKNITQLGLLFPTYGKIKHVPNHQPDEDFPLPSLWPGKCGHCFMARTAPPPGPGSPLVPSAESPRSARCSNMAGAWCCILDDYPLVTKRGNGKYPNKSYNWN